MKALMYHYVRESSPEFPHFKNLHVDDFEKQLDYFDRAYGFLSYEAFCQCLQTGKAREGVVLTFDDGLKDHYSYVLPLLQKRGLWGIFYIPTKLYADNSFLDVHKIHLLLGKYESEVVYGKLLEIISDADLTHHHIKEFRELTYSDQEHNDYAKLVKRTLNYFIGYENRQKVLDALMASFFPDERDLFQSFYLTPEEIREMHAEGMIIGSHSISHPVMSKLSGQQQRHEIEHSFQYLEGIVGAFKTKTFCYPYGGFHSFTEETERLLDQNGCAFSFNVETRDITDHDLLCRPQALPRFDCNHFPFGQCREEGTVARRVAGSTAS